MADFSSDSSVSVEMETIYLGGKEYRVNTNHGPVSVIVYGDKDKPALITYPDLALNHMSCFQGLFFFPEASSLLLHNFCIYHISPPGHELGAAALCADDPVPSMEDLADQILEVLNFFGLGAVMCMGVTAGAYILTLFALKYRERVLGLILVSPICQEPSWTEWLYNKFMSNLLYYYGICGLVKECLLKRYFSKEVRGSAEVPESDIVQACRRVSVSFSFYFNFVSLLWTGGAKGWWAAVATAGYGVLNKDIDVVADFSCHQLLDERQSINVLWFLEALNERPDISEGLKKLKCRTLVFVGDESPFYMDSIHMISKLDKRCSALVEVQSCGSMVTEEQPHAMLIPLEYFLMGYGCYRPSQLSGSPRSPFSPTCISPELLSPESMGLKLKPIKTRISLDM